MAPLKYQYISTITGATRRVTREEWLERILSSDNNPKPPQWWVVDQERNGRSVGTSYAIWHRNYDPSRKYVIWDQAHDSDFIYLHYATTG